ncbi:MAG TPA: hypothetical protein VF884_04230 [Nitrososphaeraceae archaeon]
MMQQKAPPEIIESVIRLYIDAKTNEEIQESVGLSEDKLDDILIDLAFPENQDDPLAFHLAVRLGKDGMDVKDQLHLLEAKRILVDQGARPQTVLPFISQLLELCGKTGIAPTDLVNSFSGYHKYTQTQTGHGSFDDLERYSKKAHIGLIHLIESRVALRKEQQELLKGNFYSTYERLKQG